MASAGAPLMFPNNPAGIPVSPVQPQNVRLNILAAGAPLIFTNNAAGIVPVRPVQLRKVDWNNDVCGAPDTGNNPAGIVPVIAEPSNVSANIYGTGVPLIPVNNPAKSPADCVMAVVFLNVR